MSQSPYPTVTAGPPRPSLILRPGQIALPGPVNPQRLLAAELRTGGLADYRGLVTAVAQA